MHQPYNYIYGPVSSWRYGRSLGIDPVSATQKTCSFDCVYCQVGKTVILTTERKIFVPTAAVIEELKKIPMIPLDAITFAGNGEPTLAKNIGELIREVRRIRPEKIGVITNASLIHQNDVREELALADVVIAKLDADSSQMFQRVNHPAPSVTLEGITAGLIEFRKIFKGKLALQLMFVRSNIKSAERIASQALLICPDEIEVNTPLRECPVKPLSPDEIQGIVKIFREKCGSIPVKSVYEADRKKSQPFCETATVRRRGKETA